MEGIKNQIKTRSIEEHDESLEKEMTMIQLEYVDKLISGQIKIDGLEENQNNLEYFLLNFTRIRWEIRKQFFLRKEKQNPEEAEVFLEKVINQIVLLYKDNPKEWTEKVFSILEKESNELGAIKEDKKWESSNGNKKEDLFHCYESIGFGGIFSEEKIKSGEDWEKSKFKDIFKDSGLKYDDICLSIHIDPHFEKGKQDFGYSIKSSFTKLSREIIENYPNSKAVIVKSWLLDTELGKRIGFTTCLREEVPNHGSSFWGQFIDKDGNIKKQDVKKFLETGVPKYYTVIGYMKTEDFLHKYPPNEERGKVTT